MFYFKHKITKEILDHETFVTMLWDRATKTYEESTEDCWCNLTKSEQIILYTKEFEKEIPEWETYNEKGETI